MSRVSQELASLPIGEMITSLGVGIAQAQFELDQTSADIARMMSGVDPDDRVLFGGQMLSLIELGFTPTFYQFVESTVEIKISVTMTTSTDSEIKSNTKTNSASFRSNWAWWRGGGARVSATTRTVDAKFSNKYDFSVEAASLVRTKLVPVPPPAILEERIRILMDEEAVVRYNSEIRRLLTRHRAPLVNAANGWSKRMSPDASIDSVSDLQGAIIDLHPGYRKMINDYPDILADSAVSTAFRDRYALYLDEQQEVLDRLVENVNTYTADVTKIYANKAAVQQAWIRNLMGNDRTNLNFHQDLLQDSAIQIPLDATFQTYREDLATVLATSLSSYPLDTSKQLAGPPALVNDYLASDPDLRKRINPHPSILVNDLVDATAATRFTAWLTEVLKEKLAAWSYSDSLTIGSRDDYFNQFLFSEISLARQLEAYPAARQNAATEIDSHYSTQVRKLELLDNILTVVLPKWWDKTADDTQKADPNSDIRTAFINYIKASQNRELQEQRDAIRDLSGYANLLATHPTVEEEIESLKTAIAA